jgi:Multiubiquitin
MTTKEQEMAAKGKGTGPSYFFEVDEVEYEINQKRITGGEIMDLAGIAREVGLVQILEDGTQKPVEPDEVIELRPGRRFKKRPRFRRG